MLSVPIETITHDLQEALEILVDPLTDPTPAKKQHYPWGWVKKCGRRARSTYKVHIHAKVI